MKKIKSSVLSLCVLSVLSTGCSDVNKILHSSKVTKKSNRVTNKTANINEKIGDSEVELQVISETAFKQAALTKSMLSISNSKVMRILSQLPQGEAAEAVNTDDQELKNQEESLIIGFPIGLIGEQNIFGGVITKVTDKEDETLGTLKLTDLPPVHVRTVISKMADGNPGLTLAGCFSKCEEDSEINALISFPIVGFNQEANMIMVDMSTMGKELDLISMLDPNGEYTHLKAISSDVTTVEYNMKTLVFDVKTRMVPVPVKPLVPMKPIHPKKLSDRDGSSDPTDPTIKTTDFTVRWYLKLGSGFNPAFKSREGTEGVGFFKTERSTSNKITRFSTTDNGSGKGPVKYYIKNVPEEFKKSFAKALDSWNLEFKKTIGKELLNYEFIDATDPRAEELVTGDIRYNIIEWDLDNKASYGGLGPSIANQYSGETMSANVLIQGPTIVKLYSTWYGVSNKAQELRAQGKKAEANKLIKDFNASVSKDLENRSKTTFKLKLGKYLDMNIHAQKAELEDPIIKSPFEIIPDSVSYEKYMEGYFHDVLTHEMGHNLGLRHNFKGNLGAYENSAEQGSVSRSVMEYLGRPYRYLSTVGSYDRMAIAYGYKGVAPKHLNWFCTDEDQGTDLQSLASKSPECTKSDATSDPFSFWENRLNRIVDLILETKSSEAPLWTVKDIGAQLEDAVTGLAAYALSAEKTSHTWTNFFGKLDRPEDKSEIKNYVLERLKKKLCNPILKEIISSKETAEAQQVAESNLTQLTEAVATKVSSLKLYTMQDLNCEE